MRSFNDFLLVNICAKPCYCHPALRNILRWVVVIIDSVNLSDEAIRFLIFYALELLEVERS